MRIPAKIVALGFCCAKLTVPPTPLRLFAIVNLKSFIEAQSPLLIMMVLLFDESLLSVTVPKRVVGLGAVPQVSVVEMGLSVFHTSTWCDPAPATE